MQVKEKYIIPAQESERVVSRVCDICGCKAEGGDEWSGSIYDIEDTEVTIKIQYETGTRYPDNGWSKKYEIDICPRCFKDKLMAWLEEQGVNITEIETDW